jgi:uncharacterized protein
MSLKVNLHHLETRELHLKGELSVGKLDLGVRDQMIRAEQPLHYDLKVEKLTAGVLTAGSLRLVLDCECVRCLKPFQRELQLESWTCLLPLEGEEKAPIDNDCVDLTPFVREYILVELPQHPLCKADCSGLEKNSISRSKTVSSPWSELNKLKIVI